MDQQKLKEILRLHKLWLEGHSDGVKANLQGADLQRADLRGANLRGAGLHRAALQEADLQGADLRGAGLQEADLRGANLRGANLQGADLHRAALQGADLQGADLQGAALQRADLRGATLWSTIGNKREIFSMEISKYNIVWTKDVLQIGCEQHSFEEWKNFTNTEIKEMDRGALDWWTEFKAFIFQAIELSGIEVK